MMIFFGLVGHLEITVLTMNSSVYQSILEPNVTSPVQQIQLDWKWVMEQANGPRSPIEWLKKNQGVTMA